MKWGGCNQNKLLLVDYVAVNQMLYLAKFDLIWPCFFLLLPRPPPPPYVFVGLLQDIIPVETWRNTTNVDSEDDYRTGYRNFSQCQQQAC